MSDVGDRKPLAVTVHVPLTIKVRGGRKAILAPFDTPTTHTRFDDSLLRAIARALRWQKLIEGGAYTSISELAKKERINQSYACRVLRLTLLAPDIIEAILNRRSCNLTLDKLMRPLPANWDVQRATFLFSPSEPQRHSRS